MRAWVVKTGETVPFLREEASLRLFRAGQVAEALLERGHAVTWWNAGFDHYRKTQRDVAVSRAVQLVPEAPEMIFLASRGYRRNISLARALDHHQMRRDFERIAPQQPQPDVIFCAWPTIDLADAAVRFGKARNIPVIVDVRDLWPDIIYERLAAKTGLRLGNWLVPYEAMGRRVFQGATALTALTPGMLAWGQTRFGRAEPLRARDRVFYQCQRDLSPRTRDDGFWAARGVDLTAPVTRLVWAGSMADTLDLGTLLDAIEGLDAAAMRELEFVFCGTGRLAPRVEEMASRLPNVFFGGWVGKDELSRLLHASHIGLMCYLDRFDFQLSIPNKVTDFTAAGMRILTNLSGQLEQSLGEGDILIRYPTGDANALNRRLEEIAAAPSRYRQPVPAAREAFERLFFSDRIMPMFADFIEQTAAEGVSRAG